MGKPGNVENAVFQYMKTQNRPYSASDIFLNLHKEFGKTAIVKACESLSQNQSLLEKVYGKSKIYVVHQSQFPDVDDTEMKNIDEKIIQLTEKTASSQTKVSELNSALKALTSTLQTKDATENLNTLKKETGELQKRIVELKSMMGNFDATEKNKRKENLKTVVTQYKKRKRMTTSLMDAVLEGYPKSKKQFLEEVGIETDEEYSFKLS